MSEPSGPPMWSGPHREPPSREVAGSLQVIIDVANEAEAEAVRRAMADPEIRALVLVSGMLLALPSQRARTRALTYVRDLVDERRAAAGPGPERE